MKKESENIFGGNTIDNVINDYHKRTNVDYKKLSNSDKKLIDQIDLCLKNLSRKGKEYWGTYYG